MRHSHARIENPEHEPRAELEQFVDKGIENARKEIREKFDDNPNPEERLDFHNEAHTIKVVERITAILNILREHELISEKEYHLGRYAAGRHDTEQEWEEEAVHAGNWEIAVRKRQATQNEQITANKALAYMEKDPNGIFSDQDRETVRNAILTTIPEWDNERKTVVQKNLTPDSPHVSRALALADLGAAGIDGKEQYLEEGNRIFREDNIGFLRDLTSSEPIPEAKKEIYLQKMLGWSESQISFADWREKLFEEDLGNWPDEVKQDMRKLFNKFSESKKAAREQAKRRKIMSFEELARDMGYAITEAA